MVVQLVIAALFVAAAAAGAVVLARTLVRELRSLRSETSEQLTVRTADVHRRLVAIDEKLDRRLADLDTKVLLENLLRDRLPPGSYELQYGFATGERVDAVLRVERLVPIDAKFPLDNFERLVAAETEDERTLFEKAFARDLKGHVDAIASKYIRPDEGTYDFALMYVPAESVYYELVCGRTGALLQYAHDRRVFPVSPTTFTAQLQVIALGLKGLQIEQHAHEVMAYVAQLGKDFDRFKVDFDVVGKHLGNAQSKYADAEKRLDRFESKLERATEHEPIEAPESPQVALDLPRALDAA